MSESRESEMDIALRQALRELPVPSASAGFDARVFAAIKSPIPWWRSLLPALRPAASAAFCSLLATLALLRWTATGPLPRAAATSPDSSAVLALDGALDQPDQRAGTLSRLSRLARTATLQATLDHPVEPPRESQSRANRRSNRISSASA